MARSDYAARRDFDRTPEPAASGRGDVDVASARPGSRFVVHQHHARRLHFDLRLEMDGGSGPVLASWAVPRNLPLRRGEAHLAVHVEDHPIEYADFSGTIPEGNYGAGEVRIFDSGTYELTEQAPGKLSFRLRGGRLRGEWHMTRTGERDGREEWLVFLRSLDRPEPEPPPELSPMLASSHPEPFDDDRWLFEPKWDGVRALAACSEETMLVSRNRRNITPTYPELSGLHERIVALDAILDGEIVAFEDGRPSFERLQSRINLQNPRDIERATRTTPVTYVAFDLLYLDGRNLTGEPLERRRELLEEIVVPSVRLQVSPAVRSEGTVLAAAARARRLEGIVAKRVGSLYRPGRRTKEWLKIKTVREADVVIAGWTPGEGTRAGGFGALLAGVYDGDDLVFVGAVGTGFSQARIAELHNLLQAAATDRCPFAEDPRGLPAGRFGRPLRAVRWVRPELVARVEFRELTSQRRLRAPSFKGLRTDKEPRECTLSELETAASA